MFHDAQRNILELNKSRLMALDELKQAKERIAELGMFLPASLKFLMYGSQATQEHLQLHLTCTLEL